MLVRVEYGLITTGFLFELEGWGEVGLVSGFFPDALSAVVTASATKALLHGGGDGDLSFLTCAVKSVLLLLLSLELLLLKPVLSIATFLLLFLTVGLLLTPLLLVLHGLLMSIKFSLNIITTDVAAISIQKTTCSFITFESFNTQVFTITNSSQQYHQFLRANFVIFNPDNFEINLILFLAFSVHLYDFYLSLLQMAQFI